MFANLPKHILPAAMALSICAHAAELELQTFTPRALQARSPDVVTSNWAELTKGSVRSKPKMYGMASVFEAEFGGGASMIVEAAGQKFQLLIDTGSSDLWVATEHFKCVGNTVSTPKHPTQADCAFGPLLKKASGFERIPDKNFNLTYADREYINGIPGYDTVTVAGISVPNAHINLVNKASWDGDNFTSGLIGLAYPALTSVYPGNDPAKDKYGEQIPYAPFFESMYTNTSVPPVFSLALDRKPNSHGLVGGGKIAFGGLPPVNYTGGFASSQIIIHKVVAFYPAGETHFSEYTIIPDGFVFPGADKIAPFAASANDKTAKKHEPTMVDTNIPMIVDSGTTLMYLPRSIADAVNAAFSPPAKYDASFGVFVAECTATPPKFGIVIGGKRFYLNPQDMFAGKIGHGKCATGISRGFTPPHSKLPPFSILGDTLLKSVLAVFDVGASEMRFASRENY